MTFVTRITKLCQKRWFVIILTDKNDNCHGSVLTSWISCICLKNGRKWETKKTMQDQGENFFPL